MKEYLVFKNIHAFYNVLGELVGVCHNTCCSFKPDGTFCSYTYEPFKMHEGVYKKIDNIYFCEAEEPTFYA